MAVQTDEKQGWDPRQEDMVQNSHESRGKYWATRTSVRSFARTAHLFACSARLNDKMLGNQAVVNHSDMGHKARGRKRRIECKTRDDRHRTLRTHKTRVDETNLVKNPS